MPRRKRDKDEEPVFELSVEELAFETRVFAAQRNTLTKLEDKLKDPKTSVRELSFLASTLAKLNQDMRIRLRLKAKLNLGPREAALDPEAAKTMAVAYLCSLSALDRVNHYKLAYFDETIIACLCSLDVPHLKAIFHATKAARNNDTALEETAKAEAPSGVIAFVPPTMTISTIEGAERREIEAVAEAVNA